MATQDRAGTGRNYPEYAAFQRNGAVPPPAPVPPAPVPEAPGTIRGARELISPEAPPEDTTPPPVRRRNPYVLGLWIGGLAMITAAVVAVSLPFLLDTSVSWESADNRFGISFLFLLVQYAPFVALMGVMCCVGAATVSGLAWERDRRSAG